MNNNHLPNSNIDDSSDESMQYHGENISDDDDNNDRTDSTKLKE